MAHSILVSGWRFIPHSYAVVSQFLCLELLRRAPGLQLFFEDAPYYNPAWQPVAGLFGAEAEALLRSIPPLPADRKADAEIRFGFPLDLLRPGRAARTVVFGTSETLCVPRANVPGGKSVADAQRRNDFMILTCSDWSGRGFVRSGVPAGRVTVLPLGFGPEVFKPATPEQRAAVRSEFGFSPGDFVFCHAGAMTGFKGLGLLLPAFARLARERPNVRLLLKGTDALYASQQYFEKQFGKLDPQSAQAAAGRLRYTGAQLSFADMARIYQAADCYVSPYMAEGFNFPVLEAAACGLPVICTGGGSTDDFVSDAFALRISSEPRPLAVEDAPDAMGLQPDPEHLLRLMLRVVDDAGFRASASAAGPKHVARYTWEKFADRLLPLLVSRRLAET